MRYYAVTAGPGQDREPLRIIAEFVGGYGRSTDELSSREGDAINWRPDLCRTEEELLAMEEGRKVLETWRAGDDSVHESCEREGNRIAILHDRQETAGREARPDLDRRLRQLAKEGTIEEMDAVYAELRAVGAELIDA